MDLMSAEKVVLPVTGKQMQTKYTSVLANSNFPLFNLLTVLMYIVSLLLVLLLRNYS